MILVLACTTLLLLTCSAFYQIPRRFQQRTQYRGVSFDVTIIEQDGKKQVVNIDSDRDILTGLMKAGIDAPCGCRAGMCTDCGAFVMNGKESFELDAAVLDEETTAKGFILTCSSRVTGEGLVLALGVGEDMYESQYGDFRRDHESFQEGGSNDDAAKGGLGAGLTAALNLNTEA